MGPCQGQALGQVQSLEGTSVTAGSQEGEGGSFAGPECLQGGHQHPGSWVTHGEASSSGAGPCLFLVCDLG